MSGRNRSPNESEVEGWLFTAAKRAMKDERRSAMALPPILTIPSTLSGEEIGEFLIQLSRRHPRKMKRVMDAFGWLDAEAQKAGVW